MKILSKEWWKASWYNWKNGGPLLPPLPQPKIITLFDWDIQSDISPRELASLTLEKPRLFESIEHFQTWYGELPNEVKRHIKKLV